MNECTHIWGFDNHHLIGAVEYGTMMNEFAKSHSGPMTIGKQFNFCPMCGSPLVNDATVEIKAFDFIQEPPA